MSTLNSFNSCETKIVVTNRAPRFLITSVDFVQKKALEQQIKVILSVLKIVIFLILYFSGYNAEQR